MIVGQFVTLHGFYMVLVNMNPDDLYRPDRAYKLAKFTVHDETGKVEVHSMNLTAGQIEQLRRAGTWFD
jgi:hypothetical protein